MTKSESETTLHDIINFGSKLWVIMESSVIILSYEISIFFKVLFGMKFFFLSHLVTFKIINSK